MIEFNIPSQTIVNFRKIENLVTLSLITNKLLMKANFWFTVPNFVKVIWYNFFDKQTGST